MKEDLSKKADRIAFLLKKIGDDETVDDLLQQVEEAYRIYLKAASDFMKNLKREIDYSDDVIDINMMNLDKTTEQVNGIMKKSITKRKSDS